MLDVRHQVKELSGLDWRKSRTDITIWVSLLHLNILILTSLGSLITVGQQRHMFQQQPSVGWHQDRYTGTNAGPSTKSMVDGLSPRSHIIFVSHEHSEEARMFYSTSRHSPRMGMVTFVLILTTLLTGCAWFSPNQPTPTLTRSPSPSSVASCHHLQPKLGPLRLAGLAYSP